MNIDRTKASRLLAKACAYIECGKPGTARIYAQQLKDYLDECASLNEADAGAKGAQP